MSAKRTPTVSFALLLALSAPPSLHAQYDPENFSIPATIERGAAQFSQGVIGGRVAVAQMSQQLAEARERFWRTWPDKPGFEEADAELAELLWTKDLLYLAAFAIEGPPLPGDFDGRPEVDELFQARVNRAPANLKFGELLFTTLMGRIDEGIPNHLQGLFYDWVMEARRMMGVDGRSGLANPLKLPLVLFDPEVLKAYERYRRERDRHEYMIGPHSPLGSDDPRIFLGAVLERGRNLSSDEALRLVDRLESFGGPPILVHAAHFFALTGEDPRTIDPNDFSAMLALGLFEWLEHYDAPDAKSWVAVTFMPSDFEGLPAARAEIDALLERHGDARVMEAADRLRRIGRDHQNPDFLADYSGRKHETLRWWLERLLEDPDTPLPTITEPIVIDARNRTLLEEAASRRIPVRVVGTVARAEWERGGSRSSDYLRLHVDGADRFHFTVRALHRNMLARFTGFDGERVIGRRIAIFGVPTLMRSGTIDLQLMQQSGAAADNFSFADDSLQPVETLPPGLAMKGG